LILSLNILSTLQGILLLETWKNGQETENFMMKKKKKKKKKLRVDQ